MSMRTDIRARSIRRAPTRRPLPALAPAFLLVAGPACGQDAARPTSGVDSAAVARALGGGERWSTDFSRLTVPLEEIVSGGPPKDGIPAIDDPVFESAALADRWLDGREPVIVLEHSGEAKAYPLRILIAHEIVNDVIAGRPVTVTYCPLCNTSLVFDRNVGGRLLDFGTTGRLRHSDLVMYDRQTESWWQQASGEAIVGELAGTLLDFVPANTLSWETARGLHPDIRVLSRDTGFPIDYGRNPYVGYDTRDGPYPPFFRVPWDDRYPAMERVAAIGLGEGWTAPFSELRKTHVANAEAGGTPFVVFWKPGAASAVDAGRVDRGRDVGQTAAFDRRLDGRTLDFEWREGEYVDRETGSTWDLGGRAVSGPLAGRRLVPIAHGNHFWFAWSVFRPNAEVWRAS